MNNSLSEQVAELEADHARLGRKMLRLEAERNDLQRQLQEARDERDRLKADAMSDLIKRQWLENQAKNHEVERDELTHKNTLASWKVENLKFELDKVAGERNDLRAENDALRAGQGLWPGETIASEDVPFKGMSDFRYKEPDVPRVIAADELREGQWVAFPDGYLWIAGQATLINDGGLNLEVGKRGDVHDFKLEHLSQVVLLQDAPQPGAWWLKEHPAPTGYADDDHQDAEVLQWHQPTPRLTVHDLNTAPVGSVVEAGGARLTKNHHGDWINSYPQTGHLPHEIISITSDADATLTTPEAQ